MRRLEDLYSRHDLEALGLKDIVSFDLKNVNRENMTEEQLNSLELQEDAQKKLLQRLKDDRDQVI